MARRIPAEGFPPGEIIRDELEARGWTQLDLAEILGRPVPLVNEIISGKRAVTPETAKGLGDAFGIDPQFFLNLESAYQLWKVDRAKGGDQAVVRRADLYTKAPIRELVRRRWIERSDSIDVLQERVRTFYGVKTLDDTPMLWPVAAKTAAPELNWAHWAWLVRAKRIAHGVRVSSGFSDSKFSEAIKRLRLLLHAPEETRHVPRVLAESGIRLVIVEHLPKTKWDGACFWLDSKSPVIALSLRYDRIDYFWHTLMHELWHVEKRHGLKEYIPADHNMYGETAEPAASRPEEERIVNALATETLVPKSEMDDFIARVGPLFYTIKIRNFASRIHVHPGIVVGQLQHRGKLDWSQNRELLAKVRQFVFGAALTDGWSRAVPITA